jgi:hypothetical protein
MKDGRVYFALQFLDRDLLVPVLYPLVFLGFNLDGNDPSLRFFQDFESFAAGIRYSTRSDNDSEYFHVYGPEDGKHIFEYEHALEGLMRCALNRRGIADLDVGTSRRSTGAARRAGQAAITVGYRRNGRSVCSNGEAPVSALGHAYTFITEPDTD